MMDKVMKQKRIRSEKDKSNTKISKNVWNVERRKLGAEKRKKQTDRQTERSVIRVHRRKVIRGKNLESVCNRGRRCLEHDQSDVRIGQWGRGYQVCQSERRTHRQYPGLTSRGRSEHIWTGVGHDLKNIQAIITNTKQHILIRGRGFLSMLLYVLLFWRVVALFSHTASSSSKVHRRIYLCSQSCFLFSDFRLIQTYPCFLLRVSF